MDTVLHSRSLEFNHFIYLKFYTLGIEKKYSEVVMTITCGWYAYWTFFFSLKKFWGFFFFFG